MRYIIVTPHYRRGMFETPMEKVLSYFLKLREEERRLEFSCFWGVSIMWNDMLRKLREKERPCMASSRYVLAEYDTKRIPFYAGESQRASGRRVSATRDLV